MGAMGHKSEFDGGVQHLDAACTGHTEESGVCPVHHPLLSAAANYEPEAAGAGYAERMNAMKWRKR